MEAVNNEQKSVLLEKISGHYGGDLSGKIFALWGLSFKPNTDDMREAPSRVIMEALWDAGAQVRAHDPQALEECRRIYGVRQDLTYCDNPDAALEGADALLVVTEWQSFRSPDFQKIKACLSEPVIFDGRNMYTPAHLAERGFEYYGIGVSNSAQGKDS